MYYKLDFEGKAEIGAYIRLTNKYAIVGRSQSDLILNFMKEKFSFPIVETTIASINTIGPLCVGNKNGLLVSDSCTDQELQHIRNSLPEEIRVVRIHDKLNAIGNNILCNDHVAFVNPEFTNTEIVSEVLKVPVYPHPLGKLGLTGSYGVMNSKGMIVHTEMTRDEIDEISRLSHTNVIVSTVNQGQVTIGSGITVNDFVCIVGMRSTNVEIKVAETVFGLSESTFDKRDVIEEIVFQ